MCSGPIQPSSMYTHSRHTCATPLPKQEEKTPKPRKIVTKKKTLKQLVKSKVIGIKFVKRVSKQVGRQKQKEKSMHASHFILASIFHFSSFSCCIFYTSYTTRTEREKKILNFEAWKQKKNEKQEHRPKFDLRNFGAKVTNIHAIKVGGKRNPYDLQVSEPKQSCSHTSAACPYKPAHMLAF